MVTEKDTFDVKIVTDHLGEMKKMSFGEEVSCRTTRSDPSSSSFGTRSARLCNVSWRVCRRDATTRKETCGGTGYVSSRLRRFPGVSTHVVEKTGRDKTRGSA